ncbi:MAG: pyridoxal phosphate-dependent decarboxylase family protein, partial [Solirubrobacterales bacterium]
MEGDQATRARHPALADREAVLQALSRLIDEAWESFERPRPEEPAIDDAVRARLAEPLPAEAADPQRVLADAARILDESVSPARPLYLAYIGSTGLEVGVLAAALAATYDVNLAVTARAADLLENQAVRWVSEFVGYECDEGAFTSGGMISNLTGLLTARERALPGCRERGFDGRRAAAYCSAEAHHSVVRAAEAAGIGSASVRTIGLDGRRRMLTDELDAAIARDRDDGIVPIAVVANGGTTLTGAVDDLGAVAAVCGRHGVWMHVDGAYGLPAAATETARGLFAGLERADSVTLDAHKWLGLQKSCSVVLVREAGNLEAAFGHEEAYIQRDTVVRNAVERTLEYSRPLRSLKLWLAFRTYGADSFRAWIEQTLARARELADLVRDDPEFELVCEPTLSTVCFRHLPPGGDVDAHNAKLAAAAQEDGRIYLASAIVDGRPCIRTCFVNFRTRREDVVFALET